MAGLIVRKTPRSWDGGADLIIENISGEIIAIIQCKHSQEGEISFTAIEDLLRAENSYNCAQPKLFVVTNANKFNSAIHAYANKNNQINLINAENIADVGTIIFNALK